MHVKIPCPSKAELEHIMRGEGVVSEVERISTHVETCPHCEQTLQELQAEDTLSDQFRASAGKIDHPVGADVQELIKRLRNRDQIPGNVNETVGLSATPVSGGTQAIPNSQTSSPIDLGFLAPAETAGDLGRLGHYRVLQILGKGGMGMVFLGHDPHLDRPIALKVMLPQIAANDSAKQRFLREARAAAKLSSDHIVTIHQVGEERGVPFLAMEYLEGAPLDQFLSDGRKLSVKQILRIAREVARGLADAHQRGLIHRDIKPGNIWLDKNHGGRAKILDFGLAWAHDDAHVTQSGAILGTPAYMAPEQARGEKVDARADLFSLGCMMYRLCAGDIPFKAETTMGVLMALATHAPAAPLSINREIPPALSELIMSLLEKDPAHRPGSARDVIARLQDIETQARSASKGDLSAIPSPACPADDATVELSQVAAAPVEKTPPRKRRPVVFAALACLFAGLAVLAGSVFFWQTPDGRVVRIECDDPNIKIAFEGGELKVTGAYKEAILLKPGKVGLRITRKGENGDDFEFETDKLIVNRGDKIVLRIEVVEGRVQIVQAGKGVVDAKELPVPPIIPRGNYALSFDGESSYVRIPTLGGDTAEPRTMEAFVSPARMFKEDAFPPKMHPMIMQMNGSAVRMYLNQGGEKWAGGGASALNYAWTFTPDHQAVVGKRVHLAVVGDGKDWHFFVDGKRIHRPTKPIHSGSIKAGPSATVIGAEETFGNVIRRFWAGTVHEVRISKAVRYTQDFTPQNRFKPDKDTLALYHCDEGTGDVLTDSSGNNHHGKIVGAKWVKADGTPIAAPADYALFFDGETNFVEVASLIRLDSGPRTIEAWVTPAGLPEGGLFKSPVVVNYAGKDRVMNLTQNRDVWNVAAIADATARQRYSLPKQAQVGVRTHLASVWDGKDCWLFVDGKKIAHAGESNAALPITSAAGTYLGASRLGTNELRRFWAGGIDEVRISSVVRYDKDFAPARRFESDKDTLALYHFDEGQGDELKDSSGNNHHGKIVGAKWVKADGTPIAPPTRNALQFTATQRVEIPTAKIPKTGPVTLEAYVTPDAENFQSWASVVEAFGQIGLVVFPNPTAWMFGANQGKAFVPVKANVAGIVKGKRVHVAGVRDGTRHRLFVDGPLVGERDVRDLPLDDNLKPLALGGQEFAGTIDQVRISAAARYAKNFAPPARFEKDASTLALYHFDEGQGEQLLDSSGNNHHGKIVGAKWVNADGSEIAPSRPANFALEFDSKASVQIVLGSAKKLDFSQAFTVEAWSKPTMKAFTKQHIFSSGPFLFGTSHEPQKGTQWYAGLEDLQKEARLHSLVPIVTDRPTRVAATYDGKTLRLFVDGKLVNAAPRPASMKSVDTFRLGTAFVGLLDDIRISTVCRYTADYAPGRPEKDADTLALYHMDEGQGDVLNDSSGNNHHGKIVGARWVKLETPPIAPSADFALDLDGKSFVEIPTLARDEFKPTTIEAYVTIKTSTGAPIVKMHGKAFCQLYGWPDKQNPTHWTPNALDDGGKFGAGTPSMQPGRRYHLAMQIDGQSAQLFIDGKKVGAEARAPKERISKSQGTFLGADSPMSKLKLIATLDEIRISRVFRYQGDFTPATRFEPDQDTLALYHCDEGDGDKLMDSSGNNHHGKVVGARWVRTAAAQSPQFEILHQFDWPSRNGFSVVSADVSADGKFVQASRVDEKIPITRIWDAKTGAKVVDLQTGMGRFVRGNLIATFGMGSQSVHYHLNGGAKEFMSFKAPAASTIQLTPSADHLWFVTLKKEIEVWDAWKKPGRISSFPFAVTDAGVLMPDGKHFLHQVGTKPPLIVRDAATGKVVQDKYTQLRDLPPVLAVSDDSRRLLTFSDKVRVYDVATGNEIAPFENGPRLSAVMSGDGRRLLGPGNSAGTLELWDVDTGKSIGVLPKMEDANTYKLSPDGAHAVVGGRDAVYLVRLPPLDR